MPPDDPMSAAQGEGPLPRRVRLPAAAPVNHLLRSASWARARLQPFAGRTIQFKAPAFAVAFKIRDDGEVADVSVDAADVAFTVSAGVMLRLLAQDRTAWQSVETEGDTELAREVLFIVRNLRWEAEEDLSRVFGDVVAHRLVQTGERLGRWPQQVAESFGRSLAAYWTEERPLLASRAEIEAFNRAVDELRDDVARIEQRVAKLDNLKPQANGTAGR
jgi:ubiquinone biosynthesis protein UbiJ